MSDIARPYPPPGPPGLVAGTPAANAVHVGEVERPGTERASLNNQHLAKNTGDLAK
jgi:hypothetical protein